MHNYLYAGTPYFNGSNLQEVTHAKVFHESLQKAVAHGDDHEFVAPVTVQMLLRNIKASISDHGETVLLNKVNIWIQDQDVARCLITLQAQKDKVKKQHDSATQRDDYRDLTDHMTDQQEEEWVNEQVNFDDRQLLLDLNERWKDAKTREVTAYFCDMCVLYPSFEFSLLLRPRKKLAEHNNTPPLNAPPGTRSALG